VLAQALPPGWKRQQVVCSERIVLGRAAAVQGRSGRFVAETLLEDLSAGATVDRHTADQLILFAALAHGVSQYRTPCFTDHIDSNLWLTEQFGARGHVQQGDIVIEGIRFQR
jgi:RNA 3'-terminal phosphate cyclase